MFEDGSYKTNVVLTADALDEVVDSFTGVDYFTFDVETIDGREPRYKDDEPGLDEKTNKVVWISLAGHGHSAVIPMGHPTVTDKKTKEVFEAPEQLRRSFVMAKLKPLFFTTTTRKVNQRVGFDLLSMSKYWGAVPPGPIADLQTLCHLWFPAPWGNDLGALSKKYLGFSYQKLAREGHIDTFPFWSVARYVGQDAQVANLIWLLLRERLAKREKLEKLFVMEQELTEVVIDMKKWGIMVDQPGMKALADDLAVEIKKADDGVLAYVPADWVSPNKSKVFNANSTAHLNNLLFEVLGLEVTKRTEKGAPSTDKYAREAMAGSPVIEALSKLRDLTKLRSTYVVGSLQRLDDDGRLRADFSQCGTETGRFACSNPNLQNLPSANDLTADEGKKIRALFIAAPGHVFIGGDYSQVEGRLMGDLCARFGAGTALRDVFLEPDVDWHRATAAKMYKIAAADVTSKQRSVAKTLNFALLYGGYWTLLVRKFKFVEKEAEAAWKLFHQAYPELVEFVGITCDQARQRKRPYTETLWGRRRYFPDLILPVYGEGPARKARYLKRQAAEREAVNHRIQGTSADITKSAMVRYRRRTTALGTVDLWHMLITEHDGLLIEVPENDQDAAASVLQEAMEGVHIDLSVPTPVDIKVGLRWQDLK